MKDPAHDASRHHPQGPPEAPAAEPGPSPSPPGALDELRAERERLAAEIEERKRLEARLLEAQVELERRVRERTAELQAERRAALNIAQDADEARRRAEQAEADLKREQFLLNALVENIPDPVFFKDREGRFLRVNRVMALDTNLADPAELIGKTDADIWPAAFAAETAADERAVMETGQPLINKEENPVNRAGQSRWVLVTKMPLRDESGDIVGTFGIARDVTERKERQQEIEQLNQALLRSNAELEQFASIASHDLQEPLRKIQAFGNLLLAKYGQALGAEGQDYLERMHRAAERMQALISDLLAFSRVMRRGEPFRPVELAEIVQGVLVDLEARLAETGGQVEVGELPGVEADPTQMRQLFQNLIGNALKYCRPERPPRVCVRAWPLPPAAGAAAGQSMWCIEVRDNGIGFEPKYAEQIFQPFQRLHGRGEYEGTGMGLAICRRIVERHGGSIRAEGVPDQGAAFFVTLPAQQAAEQAPARSTTAQQSSPEDRAASPVSPLEP